MNRAASGRLLRFFGWLLTPVVVWAASFLGGWLAALLAGAIAPGRWSVSLLVAGAARGGAAGLAGWLWVLRRHRRVASTPAADEMQRGH